MTRQYYDYFADHGWPVALWTLKELRRDGGLHDSMWMVVTNRDALPPLDIRTSSQEAIENFFRSLSTMPLIADDDVLGWLTTDRTPRPIDQLPPTATTRTSTNRTP